MDLAAERVRILRRDAEWAALLLTGGTLNASSRIGPTMRITAR